MADSASIAIIQANALKSLKETGPHIAALLGIEPPKLDLPYKDHDYRQAMELTALAEFNHRLLNALQTQSKGDDHVELSTTETAKRGSDRPTVSKRHAG
jgi:hypothetical protein